MRWYWPPESFYRRASPTSMYRGPFESPSINSCAPAILEAAMTSSSTRPACRTECSQTPSRRTGTRPAAQNRCVARRGFQRHRTDILAVDADGAGSRIVKTRNEGCTASFYRRPKDRQARCFPRLTSRSMSESTSVPSSLYLKLTWSERPRRPLDNADVSLASGASLSRDGRASIT